MKFKIQNSRFKIIGSRIHPPSLTPHDKLWWTRDPKSKKRASGLFILHSPFSTIWKTTALLMVLVFQASCSDHRVSESPHPRVVKKQTPPARIVSLAPSITEVLFEMDLGDRVVGVTRYCDFPPEAEEKAEVGGYFDVNYEMLLSLETDLVILLVEHQDALVRLDELGIQTLAVDHSRVAGILASITAIADRCGVKERGEGLRGSLENRMSEVQRRFSPSRPLSPSPPRVLVAVGRLMDKGSGGEVFISGRDGFYDDLISLAGGVNAYREETLKFPAISDEGLVRLDPDVILEMVPDLAGDVDRRSLMDLWRSKAGIRAVREEKVHILGEDYVVVPGPRFVDLLEDMAEIINPIEN
jgi:iron complex transport system substrate-binding protein